MVVDATLRVTTRGPIPTGRYRAILDRAETQIRQDIADEGAAEVGRETAVFKHPTGNYLRRITTRQRTGAHAVLLDDVIYDTWIEGTSRRNQTSRFKGYAVFRKATQALDARVPDIARASLRPFLRELD